MRVIYARNVNDAFLQGVALLKREGVPQSSRAGDVLVMPCPVTTVYDRPTERVLFHSGRDANHVFHLMEALWMLAGRNDATWLDQFVGDFSARFAEEGGIQHGAYGFRWRKHFDMEGGGHPSLPDQLETIIMLLKTNPDDRRIVLQMWDPVADLNAIKKDVPCNTQAYFRVRRIPQGYEYVDSNPVVHAPDREVLDMTVCCRSNDVVWGAYGANAVHFSILQEYMAARIGVAVGTYTQMSNNFHVYTNVLGKLEGAPHFDASYYDLALPTKLVNNPDTFDLDLQSFMEEIPGASGVYGNSFFPTIAIPMKEAYRFWRAKRRHEALAMIQDMPENCDWRVAVEAWMQRRMVKGVEKRGEGTV